MVFLLPFLQKLHMTGREHLQLQNPTLIIANRTAKEDDALLSSLLPPHVCFALQTKEEADFCKRCPGRSYILYDPYNPYSVRGMIEVLERGDSLAIFAEGKMNAEGNLQKVLSGIGFAALKTQMPVLPIYLEARRKGRKVRHIAIGQPFAVGVPGTVPDKDHARMAAEQMLGQLQEMKFRATYQSGVHLFNALREAARRHGGRKEIVEDLEGTLTYRSLLLQIYVLAERLKEVLAGEQRVGLLLPNVNGHIVTLFALFYLGKTPAQLNYSMGKQSFSDCIDLAQLRTILTSRVFIEKGNLQGLLDALDPGIRVLYLEDIKESLSFWHKMKGLMKSWFRPKSKSQNNEIILYTSGSEGKPKGVVLSHDNFYANIKQALSVVDLTDRDRFLNVLPMFHSYGMMVGTLVPLLEGIPLFTYPSPLHYKVIPELVYQKGITVLCATPTFMGKYAEVAHPYDFYTLHLAIVGGEKLKDEVRNVWLKKFGVRLLEGYGTTETAPILSLNTALFYKAGSVGRLLPGIQCRIEKVEGIERGGDLCVQGPNVMKGYLLPGKGFVPLKGWYKTGDVVEIDERGFVTIQARLKRFAKIAGEMVSLELVEQVAQACYGHDQLAAVQIPDAKKGEQIILVTTDSAAELGRLRNFIAEQGYSPLLLPMKLLFREELPVLSTGKVDYIQLHEWVMGQ